MAHLCAKLDFFNYTPGMKYNEGKGFFTKIGCFFSTAFYILLAYISILQLLRLINGNLQISFYQSMGYLDDNFLNLSRVPIILEIELDANNKTQNKSYSLSGVEAINLLTLQTYSFDGKAFKPLKNAEFTACDKVLEKKQYYGDINQAISKYFANDSYNFTKKFVCLSFDDDYSMNTNGVDFASYMSLSLQVKPEIKVRNIETSLYFFLNPYRIQKNNPTVTEEDINKRFQKHPIFNYPYIQRNAIALSYKVTDLDLTTGLITSSTESKEHYYLTDIKSKSLPFKDVYLSLYLKIDNVRDRVYVRYSNIIDTISYIGGIFKFLSYARSLIRNFLYARFVNLELAGHLSLFEEFLKSSFQDSQDKQTKKQSIEEEENENVFKISKEDRISDRDDRDKDHISKVEKSKSYIVNCPVSGIKDDLSFNSSPKTNNLIEDSGFDISNMNNINVEKFLKTESRNGELFSFWRNSCCFFSCCCKSRVAENERKRYKELHKHVNYLLDLRTVLTGMCLITKMQSQGNIFRCR